MIDTETLRAVVDAARRWRAALSALDLSPQEERLVGAVDALELALIPNAPVGPEFRTPWEEIPAGSYVKTPNGEWWEIVGTALLGGKQEVSMRNPQGKVSGPWPRVPTASVTMRDGSRNVEMRKAIDAMRTAFGPVSVIEDEGPPWNE